MVGAAQPARGPAPSPLVLRRASVRLHCGAPAVSEDPDELLPPMHRRVPTHFPPTLTQDESGGGHIATRSLGGASADA